MKNGDMPAQPIVAGHGQPSVMEAVVNNQGAQCFGLTKREYFAAMAMQGLLASSMGSADRRAAIAVKQADALLEQLEQSSRE